MNYEYEAQYRSLMYEIDRERVYLTMWPVRYIDTKTKVIGCNLTGRAQGALCIYCNKQIAAWGKQPTGKRGKQAKAPQQLKDAITSHVYPCAERWIWGTLARFSTELMSEVDAKAVAKWRLQKLEACRAHGYALEKNIVKMFDRLPVPIWHPLVPELEAMMHNVHAELQQWGEWEPFEHGDEKHPHRFLRTTSAFTLDDIVVGGESLSCEADEYLEQLHASHGRCPCGVVGQLAQDQRQKE